MAKKKRTAKAKDPERKESRVKGGPLQGALDTFGGGDYVEARRMFGKALEDPALSEENQRVAKALLSSIRADHGTLLVGLGCIGLYLLVILIAALQQP